MKRAYLLVLSVLAAGLSSTAAQASYPSDAEASHHLPAMESRADRIARMGESWGVSRREVTPHNPFPFGGGYVDD